MNPRHRKLLDALPKHAYKVAPAAREAGYSPEYADKNPKQILKTALKAQAQEALEMIAPSTDTKSIEIKRTLAEMIGSSREEVFRRLKYIAFDQDKDLATAMKVLAPLAKDEGVNIAGDEAKTIVPILNIGVRETSSHGPDQGGPESVALLGHIPNEPTDDAQL